MTRYKIHKGADGVIKGFGADDGMFQPPLEDGDTIEYADALPEIMGSFPAPPVVITSDNITMLDADALCRAIGAGEQTALWLATKLDL